MRIIAIFAIGAGIALLIASAFVEELLPGGRWNPYSAKNVAKKHIVYRIAAHVLSLFAAFVLVIWGAWLWRHAA